ncbi:MAG: hypothetical protein M1817_002056 [Caeruleum heppii]|nr:MAG: hypothetical protein M1817_002056 [Caeruleum heppii]
MAPISHLSNPLATPEQLSTSASRLDGVPLDLERSVHFAGARLTQAAGILLRLPQDIIAQAIIIFTRFWIGSDGGSLRQYSTKDVSAAALYLMAKLSAQPQSPRNILNVYTYLLSSASRLTDINNDGLSEPNPSTFYLSEGDYYSQRIALMKTEAHILRVLGFQTHVALPYTLAINYLQALDIFGRPQSKELSERVFAHLTTGLLSPQALYLTHQPSSLATAAIYLAAREVGLKLPAEEWWEVFDVDREELGFLVVAMRSMEAFAQEERALWSSKKAPLTVEVIEAEMEVRRTFNGAT